MAAFIDVEHALDPVYAKSLGVDIDHLIVSQPDTGEQALEIMTVNYLFTLADLYTHTRIELERTSARSSFGISVHNAYLFTHLVYEDSNSIRL